LASASVAPRRRMSRSRRSRPFCFITFMSDTEKQKFNLKTNTVITGLFGVIITALCTINHLQTDAAHADTIGQIKDFQISIGSQYETRTDHAADMQKIQNWNQRLSDGEVKISDALNVQSLQIQKLSDSIPNKNP